MIRRTPTPKENGSISPIGAAAGPIRGLVVAALALVVAGAAVALFSLLQTGVTCQFRPVTYAIFVGIVLAAVGSALGGQATVKGTLGASGVRWVVSGGAAFLLIVMGGVWWATRSDCNEPSPNIRLSAIPLEFASARPEPSQSDVQIRVRFDKNIKVKQFSGEDVGYLLFFNPDDGELLVHIDMIQNNKTARVCDIIIRPPPAQWIKKGVLGDPDKFISLYRRAHDTFDLKFRHDFINDILTTYHFDKKYSGGPNSCVEVEYYDKIQETVKAALVSEIYFVVPSIAKRATEIHPEDLSSLITDFQLYGIRAAQSPSAASDQKIEPPVASHVETTRPPTEAGASCVVAQPAARSSSALDSVIDTGVISDDDLKALFEGWCNVEERFYKTLLSTTDVVRFRLVRFVRTSIAAIDPCWASNGVYRIKNAERASCQPKLNRPRNLSRLLPFAQSIDRKKKILFLLRDESAQVRREAEILLRSYPHNEFNDLLQTEMRNIETWQPDARQAMTQAALSFYYNRIVEQQWAESLEKSADVSADFFLGLRWADKLLNPNRAVARAKLHYARAHVYLQLTDNKRAIEITNHIRSDFSELLRLSPDEMYAYTYPHHIARAYVFTRGTADEFKYFDALDVERFDRQSGSPRVTIDATSHELHLWMLPDNGSTELRKLAPGEVGRVLMQFDADPKNKGSNVWEFIVTGTELGWIKRLAKST